MLIYQIAALLIARLVELVDTSDLKFDSFKSIGSSPITSMKTVFIKPKWWNW